MTLYDIVISCMKHWPRIPRPQVELSKDLRLGPMATPCEGSVAGGSKAAVAPATATRISSSQKELHFEAGYKKLQFLDENDAHHSMVKP